MDHIVTVDIGKTRIKAMKYHGTSFSSFQRGIFSLMTNCKSRRPFKDVFLQDDYNYFT